MIPILTDPNTFHLSITQINENLSILIFGLISATAYMTSITNSLISLEGKNINILKSLPINTKTILLAKINSCLLITTPILLIGDIILFIRFNISLIEILFLILLSILIPLVSHFIGLIINLKYPKLDAENETEVVKQSMSSFLSVMLGMILFLISILIINKIIGHFNTTLILFIATLTYIGIDSLLYFYLTTQSVKDFDNLSI